jgi:hypothetical protein
MPLVPLAKGAEYYSFEFPFQFDNSAKIMVDDGIGFHDLPKDYLPGARTDGATPVHTLALMDDGATRTNSINLIQREDFYDMPLLAYGDTGLLDHYQNNVRVTALRKADQADTKDAGVVTLPTVEPGYGPRYNSSFAISSAANFDPVAAYRAGWDYNVPLITALLPPDREPDEKTASFLTVSAPDVAILAFKPSDDGNPDHYTLRLQEVSGEEQDFALASMLKIDAVDETAMTEVQVRRTGLDAKHLKIAGHETLTLRLTILHSENKLD